MLSTFLKSNALTNAISNPGLLATAAFSAISKPVASFPRHVGTVTMPDYFRTRQMRQGSIWSPEKDLEELSTVPDPLSIIDENAIMQALEQTKQDAKDPKKVRAILKKAYDNALLKTPETCNANDEYVQGLTLLEAATLLNVDEEKETDLMQELYETAFAIKERIYGNRVVMFAPLYTANHWYGIHYTPQNLT